jgi:hypothetical protein
MPNRIEEQIATYFQWVESRTGFPLHSDIAPDIGPDITLDGQSAIDDATVIELDVPNRRRPSTLRLVAIAGVAAAVIVGVILIATRPVDEPSVPANSGPPIDTVLQDEAARRQSAETAYEELQRRAQEAARKAAEAAALNTTLPAQATMPTLPSPPPTLPGSWIGDMRMTDASSGWVVTSDVLAHTSDNGATWTTQPLSSLENSPGAAQCFMLDSDHAWIVHPSTDGGVVVTRSADANATTTTTTIDTGQRLRIDRRPGDAIGNIDGDGPPVPHCRRWRLIRTRQSGFSRSTRVQRQPDRLGSRRGTVCHH